MTKEEFDKNLTKLVASMIDLNYSQETIDRTLMWLAVAERQTLEKAVITIQEELNKNLSEEKFDWWIGEYGNMICVHHTKEERRKMIEKKDKGKAF